MSVVAPNKKYIFLHVFCLGYLDITLLFRGYSPEILRWGFLSGPIALFLCMPLIAFLSSAMLIGPFSPDMSLFTTAYVSRYVQTCLLMSAEGMYQAARVILFMSSHLNEVLLITRVPPMW